MLRHGLLAAFALLALSCQPEPPLPPSPPGASPAAGQDAPQRPTTVTGAKQPSEAPTPPGLGADMTERLGPPLLPAAALHTWLQDLQQQRPDAHLLAPVAVQLSPLGITRAVLGHPSDDPDAFLAVRLDDTRLGIALSDRLLDRCPASPAWCELWLEFTWGAALAVELPFPDPHPPWPITVIALRDTAPALDARHLYLLP